MTLEQMVSDLFVQYSGAKEDFEAAEKHFEPTGEDRIYLNGLDSVSRGHLRNWIMAVRDAALIWAMNLKPKRDFITALLSGSRIANRIDQDNLRTVINDVIQRQFTDWVCNYLDEGIDPPLPGGVALPDKWAPIVGREKTVTNNTDRQPKQRQGGWTW